MKNWKKMIVTASALATLALLAGCTTASAVSLEEAKDLVEQKVGGGTAVVLEQERDDGVYELEIVVDGVRWEFEVDSRTGEVREADRENGSHPAQSSVFLTLEDAKAIAYDHAGVNEAEATDKSYEYDDGHYDIDFDHDGWDYDYEIATDGTILKSHKEPERTGRPAETKPAETRPAETQPQKTTPVETQPQETKPRETKPSSISLEEAKAIAYAHAGVKESKATDRSYEHDDGHFDIDFECDGWDYDYEIARDGTILKSHKERCDDHHHDHHHETRPVETQPKESNRITGEKALSIAMNHAGVTEARDRDVEWDDGRWEVSFQVGRTEYEYKIAADGSILHWEKEHDD